MKSDQKIIEQFKNIYKEEFGEELSDKDAFDRFSRMVNALRMVYFPQLSRPLDNQNGYDTVRTQNSQ